eukprot:XP_027311125.1 endoplasmic reticulum resident protein 27 [Anas platyrhynchos]
MGTSVFPCLFIILLAGGCAADSGSASHSAEGDAEKLVSLNDIADVEAFISREEVAVVGFFQVCAEGDAEKLVSLNDIADVEAFISREEVAVVGFFQGSALRRLRRGRAGPGRSALRCAALRSPPSSLCAPQEPQGDAAAQLRLVAGRIPEVPFGISSSPAVLEHFGVSASTVTLFRRADNDRKDLDVDSEDVNAEKMSRFIRMNELRLVTEYNPVTAVGVMHSSLEIHLLLITDKKSPEHPERMQRYRAAAELFEKKILFILVDINLKSNEQVMAYFKLKKSQLPALAIFYTPDEEHDVLPLDEFSVERVQDFCNTFLQRIQKKEEEQEKKALNEEL